MSNKFTDLSIGILAGGKSTRMGQNKALLQLNNQTIIERLTEELGDIKTPIISCAEKGLYENYSNRVVYDQNNDIGPIEGIRQLLIESDDEYVFVCACDMPFVNKDLVKYMSEYVSSDYDCYVINDGDRLQPLCAIYSKKLLPLIEKLINENKYKLFEIISNSRTKVIDLEYSKFDKKIVKNINTKSDYFEIVKPIVFAVSGYKNSGKTFMIEKLINEFINDGYSVATIKHDGHDVIEDAKDTDTYRFTKAGAKVSAALTDTRYFINDKRPVDVDELIDRISSEDSPDIIILEGFKNSKFPKVEMIRKEVSDKSIVDKSNLICIATDLDSLEGENVFNINDISGIFLCIKDFFKSE